MLKESFLRWLIVVGSDGKKTIGTESLEFFGEMQYFGCVVSACTGDNGHFALGFFQRDFHDAHVFCVTERGAFSGGSAGHKKINAGSQLALNQSSKSFFI